MAGGPAPGISVDVPGTVYFERGGSTTTTSAGKDGRFRVKLQSGTYTVTAHSPNYGGNKGLCRLYHPLVVDGATRNVTVTCSMW